MATDAPQQSVVWRSNQLGNTARVTVGTNEGHFVNALEGKQQLAGGADYVVRVRQQSNTGVWSTWSDWHQRFRTAARAD